ncbi:MULTISPECIES: hypothetical protein [unclassified Rhodococcus (in: high G+C Gram-positive bacteria)]|jgi:hypothetical protein|uniref:hypothetical protein n=1 Tax=unclassified Rhodococcus (in: high G+C Gram-positive bacteria) TaxID=192944 RepID=UPI00037FBC9A|nr:MULTISPECIES: hypothetical protein [unclassified Rhodococcus (in: high G+C Gram-positive bacteria)]
MQTTAGIGTRTGALEVGATGAACGGATGATATGVVTGTVAVGRVVVVVVVEATVVGVAEAVDEDSPEPQPARLAVARTTPAHPTIEENNGRRALRARRTVCELAAAG